jgi:hypothetical protein
VEWKAAPGTPFFLRLRVFGRVGAGEIRYPWSRDLAPEPALDSLRNLSFFQPNFAFKTP